MTIDEARELGPGTPVIYYPGPGALAERGVIVRIAQRWIYVRYGGGDAVAIATDPLHLTPSPWRT